MNIYIYIYIERERSIYLSIYIYMYISELGGSGAGFSPTPEAGNRFRFRLRCVRASERSCVSARESPSVARARQRNLWVRPRPPGAVRIKSSSSESFDR